ncbi:DeoR/GlpR family DNA-binding transcription regulator [uncultured Piscinibacter sp.]|uniref:DeoR/GlpR family DNA-binding transcription regulator n=1 Tax=uncultured Piscinibacter sp. TaxID=1131835 RepID=UPI002602905C|nr:DeoR/GlpR family DNA-binding transcription regulator [uncultured Piscinibacter sp.]
MPAHRAPVEPPRFAAERQQRIAETLREHGRVEVASLAAEYGVSEDTVRRDLRQLAARGLVQKTHGGAVALHATVLPTTQRAGLLTGAKRAIARAAVKRVEANHTLFVDGGTTTLALVNALKSADAPRPLTVVTHALDVALAVADEPRIRLVLAGGAWLAAPRIFVGDAALATVRAHRADIAFLGACALHPRAGLTAHDPQEAAIKRAMVDGAAQRIVLTDATKLDVVAPCAVSRLDEIDRVISDAAPDWLRAQVEVERV